MDNNWVLVLNFAQRSEMPCVQSSSPHVPKIQHQCWVSVHAVYPPLINIPHGLYVLFKFPSVLGPSTMAQKGSNFGNVMKEIFQEQMTGAQIVPSEEELMASLQRAQMVWTAHLCTTNPPKIRCCITHLAKYWHRQEELQFTDDARQPSAELHLLIVFCPHFSLMLDLSFIVTQQYIELREESLDHKSSNWGSWGTKLLLIALPQVGECTVFTAGLCSCKIITGLSKRITYPPAAPQQHHPKTSHNLHRCWRHPALFCYQF